MSRTISISLILIASCLIFAQQPNQNATAQASSTAQAGSNTQSATSSTTAATAQNTDAPAAVSEFALLRVYRQRRFTGSALAPSIVVDGKPVARVGSGRRCTVKLTPGTHTIGSDDKSSVITLQAKTGQEYFVRVDEQAGFWKGHGKLTLVMPEQGGPEYKLQQPVEQDRRIAKDMLEDDVTESSKTGPEATKDEAKKKPEQKN